MRIRNFLGLFVFLFLVTVGFASAEVLYVQTTRNDQFDFNAGNQYKWAGFAVNNTNYTKTQQFTINNISLYLESGTSGWIEIRTGGTNSSIGTGDGSNWTVSATGSYTEAPATCVSGCSNLYNYSTLYWFIFHSTGAGGNIGIDVPGETVPLAMCYGTTCNLFYTYAITGKVNVTNYVAPPSAVNNVTFLSQTPADITDISLFSYSNVNFTYNISTIGLSNAYLNYTIRSPTLSCLIATNGTCSVANNTQYIRTGRNISSSGNFTIYVFNLTENQIYPIRQNYDYTTITGYQNLTMTTNDIFRDEILNISNLTTVNIYEAPLLTTSTGIARIYAYNDSYDGTNPTTAPGAVEICTFVNQTTYNHTHGVIGHNLCIFNTIPGQRGFLIKRVAGTVTLQTANISYRETSGNYSTNNGATWTQANTLLSHVHQFDTGTTLYYNGFGNYSGSLQNATPQSDAYGLSPLPPGAPTITNPFGQTNFTQYINITYNVASNITPGTTIGYYLIKLLNNDTSLNATLKNNSLNTSYNWNTYDYNLTIGKTYYIKVEAYDSNGLTSFDLESFSVAKDSLINVTAYNSITGSSILSFNVSVLNLNDSSIENYSTTSGLVGFDAIRNYHYNFTYSSPSVYETKTVMSISNVTYKLLNTSLSPSNSLNITVYDELTSTIIYQDFNAQFIGSLSSFNLTIVNGTEFFQNISADTYTITISGSPYNSKNYIVTITNTSTQTLNAYLTNTSVSIGIYIKNTANTPLIATVSISKLVGSSYVTVSSSYTDVTGYTQVSLVSGQQYLITISSTGYEDRIASFIPYSANSPYSFVLTSTGSSGFVSPNQYVSYIISPTTNSLNYSNYTFSFTTNSPDGLLESFNISCDYGGTNDSSNHVSGSPSGGTASVIINTTNRRTVYCIYYYDLDGYDPVFTEKYYSVGNYNYTGNSLIDGLEDFQDENNDQAWTTILGMFIVLVLTVLIMQVSGGEPVAGTITAILVTIGLAIIGWFDTSLTILIVAIGFVWLYISTRY